MKTLFTTLFALWCVHLCAQATFKYDLVVRDNQGKPKGNPPVIFIEKNFEQLKLKTGVQVRAAKTLANHQK